MKNANAAKIFGFVSVIVFLTVIGVLLAMFGFLGSVRVTRASVTAEEGSPLSEISDGYAFLPEWSTQGELDELFKEQLLEAKPEWLIEGAEAAAMLLKYKALGRMSPVFKTGAKGKISPKLLISPRVSYSPSISTFAMGYSGKVQLRGEVKAIFCGEDVSRNFSIMLKISSSGFLTSSVFKKEVNKALVEYFIPLVEKLQKVEDAIEFQK